MLMRSTDAAMQGSTGGLGLLQGHGMNVEGIPHQGRQLLATISEPLAEM